LASISSAPFFLASWPERRLGFPDATASSSWPPPRSRSPFPASIQLRVSPAAASRGSQAQPLARSARPACSTGVGRDRLEAAELARAGSRAQAERVELALARRALVSRLLEQPLEPRALLRERLDLREDLRALGGPPLVRFAERLHALARALEILFVVRDRSASRVVSVRRFRSSATRASGVSRRVRGLRGPTSRVPDSRSLRLGGATPGAADSSPRAASGVAQPSG
jgi:hypothetical protein